MPSRKKDDGGLVSIQTTVANVLPKIRSQAERLNKLADNAVATVRQVEKFIDESHLGRISASVSLEQDEDSHSDLEILRWGGKYRIVVCYYDHTIPPEQGGISTKPFAELGRDDKLFAFQRLPDLLINLTEHLEIAISITEQTSLGVAESLGLPTNEK